MRQADLVLAKEGKTRLYATGIVMGDYRFHSQASGYQIGQSFFCSGADETDSEAWYRDVVSFELRPLLEEYWMDDTQRALDEVKALLA